MIKSICEQIEESVNVKNLILSDFNILESILKSVNTIVDAYKNSNKTLIAGNGGSAADAQHFAAELVGRFYLNRSAIPALALTTDTSILTAVGNDFGYKDIFSRQVEAFGAKGDIFIGISTSGNSANVINALNVCKVKEIFTIGLTGSDGGMMDKICDVCIKVPSKNTPRIQEAHLLIEHIMCNLIESELFNGEK